MNSGEITTNISNIPKITVVENGDYFLIETPVGTKLLDYQNLVIGTDNITFSPTLSALRTDVNSVSSQLITLSATTLTTFDELSSNLTEQLETLETNISTLTNDVSSLSEDVTTLTDETDENTVNITTLSANVINNTLQIESIETDISNAILPIAIVQISGITSGNAGTVNKALKCSVSNQTTTGCTITFDDPTTDAHYVVCVTQDATPSGRTINEFTLSWTLGSIPAIDLVVFD